MTVEDDRDKSPLEGQIFGVILLVYEGHPDSLILLVPLFTVPF
jgi:hypothetical protein